MQLTENLFFTILTVSVKATGCAGIPGETTDDEQRKTVDLLVEQTLADLYKQDPKIKDLIADTFGYAVMQGIAAKYPIVGTGSGYGVAINNQIREKTFLEITEFTVGAGLGVRTLRFVVIFKDEIKFNKFKNGVWKPRTLVEAAAKSKNGGTAGGTGAEKDTTERGYSVHIITDSGVSATATLGIFHAQPVKLKE